MSLKKSFVEFKLNKMTILTLNYHIWIIYKACIKRYPQNTVGGGMSGKKKKAWQFFLLGVWGVPFSWNINL